METDKNNNLPIIVNNKSLANSTKYKKYDSLIRTGKALGALLGGIGAVVIGTKVIGGPAILIGAGVFVEGFVDSISSIRYKREPGLMFVSKRNGDENIIEQSSRLYLTAKMMGYNQIEKAAMMTLQAMVGLSRYKETLEESPYYERDDGSKVYTKMFSTITHSVNLKTFKKLSDLGIIEIDPDYPEFKNTGKKSALFFEKWGFGRYKDAFMGLKNKTEMKEVRFRLTDKPIDFEDMYKKINGIISYESQEERKALSRFSSIFKKENGILSTKDLDIEKDSTGRTVLRYGRKNKNFGKRMEEKIITEQKIKVEQENEFDERIKDGVTPEIIKKIESGELVNQERTQSREKDDEKIIQ